MKFRKLSRVLSAAFLDAKMAEAQAGQSVEDECEHRCTGQGRTAHLWHPEIGELCPFGADANVKADPSLPVCRLCLDNAEAIDELRSAS